MSERGVPLDGFWWRPLISVALASLIALVVGLMAGARFGWAILALFLLVFYAIQLWNLRALDRWLARPELDTLPDGVGLWENVFAALFRLQRSQGHTQEQLEESLLRFQEMAGAMPDGIVVLNAQGQIEWCNPRAAQDLHLDSAHDRGRHLTHLVRVPQFVAYLSARQFSEPLVMKSPGNRETTLSILLVPFSRDRTLLLSRDISQLERVDTVRRDFIANVSHELRTPLTVLAGFLETLYDMELSREEEKGYLQLMQDQTRRMQRLVDDLLTLSRLEGPASTLQEEKVDMGRMMDALLTEANSLSGGRHTVEVSARAEEDLLGNENELRSAFGNLISNAVRYTPEGGTLTLGWEVRNGEGVFSVRDTGEGIEPQHLPRLTERFYRVDRSRSRETGGTGLGLSIVKHVLSRHQGRLEVTSTPGQGSTFSAHLPGRRLLPPT